MNRADFYLLRRGCRIAMRIASRRHAHNGSLVADPLLWLHPFPRPVIASIGASRDGLASRHPMRGRAGLSGPAGRLP